ncbi:hypothetical protein [Streptomyces sp. BH104]|uniref:hypothetical protein n=1 Tax=Streptomyces sp. BH104 TaxID=3410407 RepID=UPI003BB5FA6E
MNLRPRSILGRLGVLADPGQGPEDTVPDAADTSVSDSEDSVPNSADTRQGASRLPDWWQRDKPLLDTYDNGPGGGEGDPKPPCEHPNPHEVRAAPTGELVAYWCEGCETQLEVPELEDGDNEPEDGDAVPSKIRGHWRRKGSAARIYRRPAYRDSKPAPRQSLIQWWLNMDAPSRWLLYNGVALGIGFQIGVPQFFKAETAYLAVTYGSWTAWPVFLWYGLALAIWVIDHRTRGWFPLFALAGRIPLISMVVGCLLYGSTDLVL